MTTTTQKLLTTTEIDNLKAEFNNIKFIPTNKIDSLHASIANFSIENLTLILEAKIRFLSQAAKLRIYKISQQIQ